MAFLLKVVKNKTTMNSWKSNCFSEYIYIFLVVWLIFKLMFLPVPEPRYLLFSSVSRVPVFLAM